MKVSTNLYLGGIAAIYVLWLCCWLVVGDQAFGVNFNKWDQGLVTVAAVLAAFIAALKVVRPYSVFMTIQGVGLILLTISWLSHDSDGIHNFLYFMQPGLPNYSNICYSGFVFSWVCAWGYLAIELWHRYPPTALTKAVFSLLFFGLALILASFYYSQYNSSLNTIAGRLDAVTAGLEFLVLLIGLGCILLKAPFVINWMLLATALLIASDMVYSEQDVPAGIEAVWMFGQFLLLSSYLLLSEIRKENLEKTHDVHYYENKIKRSRSDLSGVLILLSLGGLLMMVVLGLIHIHVVWKAFFAVLFIVALVVSVVWLTDHFDDGVQYLKKYTKRLHQNRLEHADWRAEDGRIHTTLLSTGLGEYLDSLSQSVRQLKQDVIFLGPERLYPEVVRSAGLGQISCFIVMPFSLEWSDDVHRILSGVCKSLAVQPMRGDDVFKPSDILVDIWQSINIADFVIADISGRNPNVLYELGIAHTLAKPVLIISKNTDDIPIDLSTRRVIIYGQNGTRWQDDLETKVTLAIQEIMHAYSLNISAK
ncbi:hypothetical protein [Nitrosomonas sp. Nm33]|uniref:hypothetical protein n=1 Tax=Nitrosomonas sp. Nm33 TaxID=133724 RepID=UPI000898F2CF|nr:hypothetical protein [Nitrosomonas sp. Nm33]SDY01851.1 hypothetical protein SAMN05421755_10052 [Nitrosomonas sp. Nm33]